MGALPSLRNTDIKGVPHPGFFGNTDFGKENSWGSDILFDRGHLNRYQKSSRYGIVNGMEILLFLSQFRWLNHY